MIQIFELCSFIATAAPPPPTTYEDATVNPTASPTHAYNYDPAGNRTSVLGAGVTTNYTTNSVNAYTNISGGGILPPSQNPDYDPNGNMLTGPVGTDAATLTYDNEHARRLVGRAEFAEQSPERGDFPMLGKNHQNRLRTITQNGTTTGYTYDALSRCIESFNNTSPTDNRERYTWSGWTLLNRELFTGTTPTSCFRYSWGLDLSESLEGAGGVGGLLAIERIVGSNTDIRFPHYDANGNIIALTDSTGNVSARYRYDAFGKVLSVTDLDSSNWVNHNIHRFSTKPTFGTPDLLYYGYRFYTPTTGRWINRDPIEEKGGLNFYGFVVNDGLNMIDLHGLACEKCPEGVETRPGFGQGECKFDFLKQVKPPGKGNGCGAQDSIFSFPGTGFGGADFVTQCNKHNACYGDCKKSKQQCDDDFLDNLLAECDKVPTINMRATCKTQAHAYYAGVGNGGGDAFAEARKQHCKWTPCCGYTLSDLIDAIIGE